MMIIVSEKLKTFPDAQVVLSIYILRYKGIDIKKTK